MIPTGAIHNDATRVLLATIAEPAPRSMRRVSDRAGLPWHRTQTELVYLRKLGLIAFEDTKTGTLRPLVEQVR